MKPNKRRIIAPSFTIVMIRVVPHSHSQCSFFTMANCAKFAVSSLNTFRILCAAAPKQLRFAHQLPQCRQMVGILRPDETIINYITSPPIRQASLTSQASPSPAVDESGTPAANVTVKTEKVSKAMRAYIQRAQEHDEFMKVQEDEYRIGKRHLANMMGEDPETFTQDDVNVSYSLPFHCAID